MISNIQKSLGKGLDWSINSVVDHTITKIIISKKSLINIQNIDDNECFKWFLVRYLYPADHYPAKSEELMEILQEILTLKIKFLPKSETFTKPKK